MKKKGLKVVKSSYDNDPYDSVWTCEGRSKGCANEILSIVQDMPTVCNFTSSYTLLTTLINPSFLGFRGGEKLGKNLSGLTLDWSYLRIIL